jgi:hypothetical protein
MKRIAIIKILFAFLIKKFERNNFFFETMVKYDILFLFYDFLCVEIYIRAISLNWEGVLISG